jgi:hypothetical protein
VTTKLGSGGADVDAFIVASLDTGSAAIACRPADALTATVEVALTPQ